MKFTLENERNANVVKAFAPGEIRIGERVYARSLVLSATDVVEDWTPAAAEELDEGDLEPALALEPEVIVLGTGPTLAFPSVKVRAGLAARGVGLEVMDTAAACRTYNVLLLEGRAVVAALIL